MTACRQSPSEENPNMLKWRAALATVTLLAAGWMAHAPAWAQAMIQSISSSQQAGTEVVRIELSEALAAVPGGFAVQTPPRIAIDLPGVGNAMGRSTVEVNQGNLRSVTVAQAGERTRLVLNLKQPANFRAQLQGKALLVLLDPTAPVVAAAEQPVLFAPTQNAETQGLRDIDFRRGQDGSGRIVVGLPSTQVGVDIRQQGQTLVVEFLRSTLPDALRRRLDVTDFGTPVQSVTTFQSGDRVRMVVEPRGAWEHSAYQTDNQFVLEVRSVKVDPNKLTQGVGFSGEKLSLNFQNIEVRALLQVIADFTNFNVVTSDSVTGSVTLRLKDVPWDQALDIILQSKGLGVRKSGNVLWIAPKDELASKEQLDLEARKKVAELEPLRTQSFQLNYTRAETIAKALIGSAQVAQAVNENSSGLRNNILSARGSVIFEARTNQLFITDIPSKLEEVQALLSKIDIPVRQVLIEARIVEADDTFSQNLGVRFGVARITRDAVFGGGTGVITSGTSSGTSNPGTGLGPSAGSISGVGLSAVNSVNLPAATIGGFQPGNFALTLVSSGLSTLLNLEISALQADGRGKIVSSPRVITADKVKATIEQGTEIPYQQSTSSGATSISFKKAVLKLEVTPQITPEGAVFLDVKVNKDSRGQDTASGPAINTKNVQTQVLVENGGTVVLGGIYEQEEKTTITKVPFLGDLPVVGNLFRNRTMINDRKELMIFITPRVVSERVATAVR
jgi:type IV pilus assembly protein PilQ